MPDPASVPAVPPAQETTQTIVVDGTWTPAEAAVEPYRYLPFGVPPLTRRIDVAYQVAPLDPAGGPALLSIGLFDDRGLAFLEPNGFRGWTGAFRDRFFVAPDDSTPGYRRGPLPAGTWHVLLDSSEMAAAGCAYTVTITCTVAATAEDVPAPRSYPRYAPGVLAPEARWYRGNLHAHTYHSDGANSVAEMAAEHRRWGLDFGAMTDHNLVNPELALGAHADFLWLPGEEVTTQWGHLNVWGLDADDWLDFRCTDLAGMEQIIAAARARGALTSINHPKEDGPDWIFPALPETDAFEVWQAPWFLSNYVTLALWQGLLAQGRRPTAVGGSDLHRISTPDHPYPYLIGNPTTWVYATELSIPGLLAGLRAGHVFISADPTGPQLLLQAQTLHGTGLPGDQIALHAGEPVTVQVEVIGGHGRLLRLVDAGGVLHESLILSDRQVVEYSVHDSRIRPGYILAQLIAPPAPDVDLAAEPDALWVDALTNPVYFRVVPRESETAP
ncbi:MAG TPA: CehA/McbA family metallohydrolase [Chloroflexia bacterium]|nr:CehA/McbA family metallohydrolase [Chloroflexia bacterium]